MAASRLTSPLKFMTTMMISSLIASPSLVLLAMTQFQRRVDLHNWTGFT